MPPPPAYWRITGAAARRFNRAASFPIRYFRLRSLRAAYRRGSVNTARDLSSEDPDPVIVETGRVLRQELLDANAGKHARADYRVLMVNPGSITAAIWFEGLQSCLQHAGIECRVLPSSSRATTVNAALESFQPNILIAVESTPSLQSLDLPFIYDYKRHRSCLRLFVPVWLAHAPDGGSSKRHDAWRRSLRQKDLLADAHFSIFEPEFHERFMRDRQGPHTDYVTVAQACDPFTDQPSTDSKRDDYFMATSLTDERVEVSYRLLRPILARYRGSGPGRTGGSGARIFLRSRCPSITRRHESRSARSWASSPTSAPN